MLQKRIPTAILVALAASTTAALAVSVKPDAPASTAAPDAANAPAAASRTPSPTVPPSSHPVEATAQDGSLTMAVDLSHNVVGKNQDTVWLRVGLQAANVEGGKRPPLDVALVVDRSGSMSGTKIEEARLASRALVDRLGPDDRMSIVAFNSEPFVATPLVAAATNSDGLNSAIDGLYGSGGTSIYDGYYAGLGTLTDSPRNASRVVFLLSDGLGSRSAAELGEATAQGLRQHDTTVTTLGIGDDFDEQTLGAMAVRGGGKFYYVETPEKLREHLNAEWEGLANAAARGVTLRIDPADGLSVRRVLGYTTQAEDGVTSVQLDSMFSERERQIMVELAVDPTKRQDSNVQVTVTYDDVSVEPAVQVTSIASVPVRMVDRAVTVDEENSVVLRRVRRVSTALAVDQADKLLLSGQRADAEKVLAETLKANNAFGARHGGSEELSAANKQLEQSTYDLTRPIQEKRQIRVRKHRKKNTIEIISGDRK